MIAPLKIPPGVVRNGTEYQNAGRWYDANLVRWFEGTMRPVGGWRKATNTQLSGPPRGMLAWRENDFLARLAIGTPGKLYIYSAGSVYDITPTDLAAGRVDSFIGSGYGFGVYSNGDYSRSQTITNSLDATTWSFDSWGENLIACHTTDGRIFNWLNDVTQPAEVISGAPVNNSGILVTPERHLVAYGADGIGKQIKWCSSEDNTTWTPTATNSAGGLILQTDGRILSGKRVRGETAFLTETELHVMRYIGQPFIYSVEKVGSFCGLIGGKASEVIEGGLVWMSQNAFFIFDGTLRPLPCDVSDHIFGDINRVQSAKITAGHNARFGEVWWFYPSRDSNEVNRYVTWNYRENHWSIGTLARTAWADGGVFEYPMATSASGYLYEHECGWTADGAPITTQRFARSGPVEISDGAVVMHVSQILPDERSQGSVEFSCRSRFTSNGAESVHGPFTVAPYTDARITGRQIALDVEGQQDEDWRLGRIRFDVKSGGRR